MEAGSDGDGSKKPKRQMKTPFQLETLEKTYRVDRYPTEATRLQLSEQLGLTDRQLQMWFCHRRLKDKKEEVVKKPPRTAGTAGRTELLESSRDDLMVAEHGSDHGSGSRSRSESRSRSGSRSGSGSSKFENGDDVPLVRRVYQPLPQRMVRRVIDCVEAQLGELLREDGPILGMEFDELPPGAFGTPIVVRERRERPRHSYEGNLFEQPDAKPIKAAMKGIHELAEPSIRSDAYGRISHYYDSPVDDLIDKRSPFLQGNGQLPRGYAVDEKVSTVSILSQQREPGQLSSPLEDNDLIQHNEEVMQMGRKRKNDEAITGRDVQAHEKRIRKELEKQDLLRRKREEQMRKEMEKQDRERRKEEERMMREKQRQEERFQREEKREIERREKFLQKESLKAERNRQKEELRKEKEALRLKAAVERATARRIAKEYMELIEDERLEMMELAASSKGLPSIISLDHDTLQNLDSFRDSLCAFPPKSVQVQLKRPFTIQPWIDSDDNIGNLLMVWRFCMTFADVLRLWPFTLDEFVQAFHDYDSRLLAEVHIALLKLIIRDIEDVARTPCGGLGTNQYTAANPEGGHPRIVEGAYMWGFDIRNWLNHINPLTWPEILRQFALSAGFGPQLKKESIERPCLPENDEGKGCEDIVSMLRSGSAAENAATLMQEKGVNLQRKSRHRLTPGTVKFAAYHVLCLEGSKGLTVLELADKIQKSGLRDLSTSKTPDASISVALSRDPILFERIAPSTYCVRPDFRKDPANAEEVISAAREKIQRFLNGILGGENADDVEKDDDSECDLAEGPEVDDLGTPATANNSIDCNEVNYSGNGKHNLCDDVVLDMQNEVDTTGIAASNPNQGGSEIDESNCGEPWVQGLTEGEYSDLCVEERLNALVALIGIANEGNSIRAVLEDRLDAATSVRKQMWAEAQLDKKRIKEECVTKCHDSSFMVAAEGGQSPVPDAENKYNEDSLKFAPKEEPSVGAETSQNHLNDLPPESNLPIHEASMGQITPPIQQNGYSAERSRLQLKAFIGHKAEEMYAYRSLPLGQDRRRNRYWQFVASTSKHDPGTGRIFVELHNGSWRLIDTEEAFDALLMLLDTRGERESHLHIMLQKIEMYFKQNVRRVFGCDRKVDECVVAGMGSSPAYVASAESPSSGVCVSNSDTWQPSSSFKIELGRTESEKKNALKRYQDLEMWMWKECFSLSTLLAMRYGNQERTPLLGICDFCHESYLFKEAFCPSCHRAFGTFDNKLHYPEHAMQCEDRVEGDKNNVCRSDPAHPLRIRLIKALITLFEVLVPSEALQSSWVENHRVPWGRKLHAAVSTGDLLQILTQFENAIKRDCLSPDFETTEELLSSCALLARTVCNSAYPGSVPELPWVPQTTAAVSLRLLELDASVSYNLDQKSEARVDKEAANIVVEKFPSRYAYVKNIGKVETAEMNQRIQEDSWAGVQSVPGNSTSRKAIRSRGGGGGGGRPRGRSQKRASVSISAPGKQNTRENQTLSQVVMHQKHGRGRRTVRRRRIEKVVEGTALNNVSSSPRNYERERWVGEENREMEIEDAYNGRSDREANNESEDSDHAIRYERGNWGSSYDVASNTNRWNSVEMMDDEDSDGAEEENEFEEDDENLERDVEMNDGSDGNAVGFRDDDSDSLVSGDYSD